MPTVMPTGIRNWPLERTFGESRRRVKVIGRLPGESTCLSLVTPVPSRRPVDGKAVARPILGGLHYVYERAA